MLSLLRLVVWLIAAPGVGFLFLAAIFAPGYLIAGFIARKIERWRPLYWIPAWGLSGLIASFLVETLIVATDRNIIMSNIDNGIVSRMTYEFAGATSLLVVLGLLCGICYWVLLLKVRTKKTLHA